MRLNRVASGVIGLLLGASVGMILAMLFAPSSGRELVRSIRESYDETMDDARLAAQARRAELEAELAAIQRRATLARR